MRHVFERTFFIKAEQYGTCFAVDVDDDEYIVTAAHLLPPPAATMKLSINLNKRWETYDAIEVGRCAYPIDIAVLKLPNRLVKPEFPVVTGIKGLAQGQDVYFLGYPYKLAGDFGFLQTGAPLAYVKRGTVSLLDGDDRPELTIDAINNEGFSGGPLIFKTPEHPDEPRIAAVVSKFRIEEEEAFDGDGKGTKTYVKYNTGFMLAYGIHHAIELVKRYRQREATNAEPPFRP